MLTHPALISILKLLYPIEEPDRTRDRPLEVLALGLSRSGTDSLRQALIQLGYSEVHHAFHMLNGNLGEAPQWSRLFWRKYHTDPALTPAERGLDAAEFDKVLGNCMAATDIPCAALACQLVKAYPNAKVILNRRDDIDAWYQSVLNTVENSPFDHPVRALFETSCFWIKLVKGAGWHRTFKEDFTKHGKDVFVEHYEQIENLLAGEEKAGRQRQVLRWKVQDGWQSLVAFLGKEVPSGKDGAKLPFPSGNAPAEFEEKRKFVGAVHIANAERRMRVTGALIVGAVAVGLWWELSS